MPFGLLMGVCAVVGVTALYLFFVRKKNIR
jgi:hypothetical protein